MTGHPTEEELAQYAERPEIERHAAECAACAAVVAEFRAIGRAFADDVKAEDLRAVRLAVMKRVARRKSWQWAMIPAALVAGLLVFWSWPVKRVPPAVSVAVEPVLAAQPLPAPELVVRGVRRRKVRAAGLRAVALVQEAGKPEMLRMTTADPSVVILWQMGEKGNVDE